MSKKYNSYTRDFPMTLDRDKPLPGERANEVGFASSLPEDYCCQFPVSSEGEDKLKRELDMSDICCCMLTKTVTPDALNLREEPNGKILCHLKKGDTVTVLSESDDKEWTHVHTDLSDGWVMSKYLK